MVQERRLREADSQDPSLQGATQKTLYPTIEQDSRIQESWSSVLGNQP